MQRKVKDSTTKPWAIKEGPEVYDRILTLWAAGQTMYAIGPVVGLPYTRVISIVHSGRMHGDTRAAPHRKSA